MALSGQFSITRCQMASCGVETVGEARMEDHWEADHKDRLVEEWHYQVSSTNNHLGEPLVL